MVQQRLSIRVNSWAGRSLLLLFSAVCQVACVPKAGNDVSFGCQFIIYIAAPNGHPGLFPPDVLNTNGTCNGTYHMNTFRSTFIFKEVNGFNKRRSCGQHGVAEDQYPVCKIRTGYVFETDLKRSVPVMFPIS